MNPNLKLKGGVSVSKKTTCIAHVHKKRVKNLIFIKNYVYRYSLSAPEYPIYIQRHSAEIFNGTYYGNHTVHAFINHN